MYRVNRDIFFVFTPEGEFAVWDYRNHLQFSLTSEYFQKICECAKNDLDESSLDEVANDLIREGILLPIDSEIDKCEWKWDVLSRIFHVGTSATGRPSGEGTPNAAERARSYVERCDSILEQMPDDTFMTERGFQKMALPAVGTCKDRTPLIDILAARKTSRSFTGESLAANDISMILTETFSYREHSHEHYNARGLVVPAKRRSSPSGGSLQVSEAYLVALNVDGIARGVYHYRSHDNELALVSEIPDDLMMGTQFLFEQAFSNDASAFIIITSRFEKMWWKYPASRAYRVANIDVGHLSQTALLLATELGMNTWLTAAFVDEDVRDFLKIEPLSAEYPMLVLGFGTGAYDPVDKNYLPAVTEA
jgi:SagB-type dehydrogenase family enzyme